MAYKFKSQVSSLIDPEYFTQHEVSPFPVIKSQRQIDLEASWWKERITLYDAYLWSPWEFCFDSFYTSLDGYWWKHHELFIGPLVIEWRTRGRKMLTHQ